MSQLREITIQGAVFSVADRYAEGHALTAGEASALNQTRAENLRNNCSAELKKLREANAEAGLGDALTEAQIAEFQTKLDAYAAEYQFGIRVAREPLDPVEAQAIKDMAAAIRAKLKAKGQKPTAEQVDDLIARYRTERPEAWNAFYAEAKKKVDLARKAAAKVNDLLD